MLSKTRFQALLQYTRKKDRAAAGAFFVDGWRWLEEALDLPNPPLCVLATVDAARTEAEKALLVRARSRAAEFFEVTPEQLGRLTESVSAPGVAALVRWQPVGLDAIARALPANGPALVVVLDGVGVPGNGGTIVRTADWFGASGVVFGPGSVEPTNPKLVRTTMGSLFHLPIAQTASLSEVLSELQRPGLVTVGAALDGIELPQFTWPARAVLVIGNEANGIQEKLLSRLDHRVRIPSFGRAESLNAAVAAAVLLADWRRSVG